MTSEADEILIEILARRDAIFTPNRRLRGCNANANCLLRRQDYVVNGISWASDGRTALDRKHSQVALESLVDGGLLASTRDGGRTAAVQITDAGEHRAQCLAMLPTLRDGVGWILVEAIGRRKATVHEDHLIPAWRRAVKAAADVDRIKALVQVMNALLPFLVRGWVIARSTMTRNARYWLPSGVRGVRPTDELLRPPGDEDSRRAYCDYFNAEYASLATDIPLDTQEIGEIPLSCSASTAEELADWKRSAELAAQQL